MPKIYISEKSSSFICEDTKNCTDITVRLCKTFPSLKESCAATCRFCKCEDSENCLDVTDTVCANFPSIRDKCHKTCGVCKDRGILFYIILGTIRDSFMLDRE